jgi:teichuronic acid biosynthesis glycosyltransferase TuaC
MKVLSVLPETSSPIGMIFSYRQIRSLEKLGVVNHTFLIPSKGLTFSRMMKTIAGLRRTIKEYQPDLVHVHYGDAYAFIAAVSGCYPLVITFHGSDLNAVKTMTPWKNLRKLILSNGAILRAKKVICVSSGLKRKIWWRTGIAQIVPLGIDNSEFRPIDRQEARTKLGWGSAEKIILFNANDPKIKRLDIAEKVVEIVKREIPEARLEILGGKEENRTIIPLVLNASDCLLICSDSEGSPMMVKEALACNVPVVGVDVGDVRERLEGVWPSKVTAKEPSALAEAVLEVIGAGVASNGREKLIADHLSEESVAKKILAIYSAIPGK